MDILLWVVAVLMIAIGVVGTVVPALPGTVLVLAGSVLAAWIDDFTRISSWTLGILAALTVLSFVVEYVAGLMGAKKAGASTLALVGAALGTFAGIFTGLVGLLFLPLVGAAIGEFLAQRDFMRAGKVGVATWIGFLVGTALKVAIVFTMIGVLVVALIV